MAASDDRVGPGKPPRHSRFRKGESGNPNGRPKGRLNVATVLERTLRERVVINESGERKTITKLEAAVQQLVNKAATGDMSAFKLLSALAQSAEERVAADGEPDTNKLAEIDQKILQNLFKRFGSNEERGDK